MPTSDGWWEPEFKGANRLVSIGQASGLPRRTRRTEAKGATHFLAPGNRGWPLPLSLVQFMAGAGPAQLDHASEPQPPRDGRGDDHGDSSSDGDRPRSGHHLSDAGWQTHGRNRPT